MNFLCPIPQQYIINGVKKESSPQFHVSRDKEKDKRLWEVIISSQMTVTFHQKGNYQSFKRHLKKILKIYRHHSKIIMVVDNVRFHHAKLLKKWLINNTKLELVYLPPYSPELNPIERAWWYMRKKITHNRYVKTLKERKVVFWKMFSHFQQPNDELLRVCEINY
jgi:transposase